VVVAGIRLRCPEVIDVRLAHGPGGSEDDGWLAYGTLRTTGLSPLIPEDEPMPRA
jgi:hypothetical protein